MSHEDGEWWVAGDLTPPPSEEFEYTNHFVLIERVDRKAEDPAQRMNYWREQVWTKDATATQYVNVRLVEVHVSYVQPRGWETTDHRPLLREDSEEVVCECACGQLNYHLRYDGKARTVQEARSMVARWHDQHLTEKVPNLRCARCGERSHSIDYCERDA